MNIYLPFIATGLSLDKEFAQLLLNHPEQQREVMLYSDCLNLSAKKKVDLLIEYDVFSHTVNGQSANALVKEYCNLHDSYDLDKNYVEALIMGVKSPSEALGYLVLSPSHRPLLLGEGDFFKQQNYFGIGYREHNNNYWYCIHCAHLI